MQRVDLKAIKPWGILSFSVTATRFSTSFALHLSYIIWSHEEMWGVGQKWVTKHISLRRKTLNSLQKEWRSTDREHFEKLCQSLRPLEAKYIEFGSGIKHFWAELYKNKWKCICMTLGDTWKNKCEQKGDKWISKSQSLGQSNMPLLNYVILAGRNPIKNANHWLALILSLFSVTHTREQLNAKLRR